MNSMTAYTTLITADQLAAWPASSPLLLLDCSFELSDVTAGRRAYAAGHLPGAHYVHLDETLSGPKTGSNGRHPLPTREAFAASMGALGLLPGMQVVVYDNAGGMYAARLWWMLRWVGHAQVAVLDGGVTAWTASGRALTADPSPVRPAPPLPLRDPLVTTVDYQAVRDNLQGGQRLLLDARGADRFRGENETMDPVGGHIPGAVNRPFKDNLGADGRFKPAAQLRAEYDALRGGRPASQLVSQCGSGVTACHNLLAMELAGLPGAPLYPGSWSEWCAQPGAPVAT